jgi:hypothetical protein
MKTANPWRAAAATSAFLVQLAGAQVPGEDPVILKGKTGVAMQPTAPPPKSGNLDGNLGMSSSLRARVARYEAKAFSSDASGISTSGDVMNTITAEGMQRTCIQDVGSNTLPATPGMKYGPNQTQQIVVLRGDLVNICK